MRVAQILVGIIVLLLGACAGVFDNSQSLVRQQLAPTGKLRVALVNGTPPNVVRNADTGEMKGVGYDLGKQLADRLRVPFEPMIYPSVAALLEAGKSGHWDVTFNGVTPERAAYFDFTAPHLELEFGYLVPADSMISTLADVDQPGTKVAAQEKGAADIFLSQTLKHATLVRAAGLAGAFELLKSADVAVLAANKPNLFELTRQLSGYRLLDGSPGRETQAMLIPKGRGQGVAYADQFIAEAKANGLVAAAIERVGLRWAVVP